MTRKAHVFAMVLSMVPLAVLILIGILIASAWLDAWPIVDMRL